VNSEPGKGSRFRVSLPVEKTLFKEEELVYGQWQPEENFINRNLEKPEEKQIQQITRSQLPLLLVVEDNSDLRQFITDTVNEKYNVIEAINGQDGLERAIHEIPDIIVSDVMMPIMDGFTLTQKLKKDERTSHIPVILLTAKAGQAHKLEGLNTGADDYLVKPFDAPELILRIQNLVNQRKLLRRKYAGDILLKPSEVAVKSTEEVFLQKVMEAIESNMSEEDFGVEELARQVMMSRSQLHRKLIALTGQSPSEVIRNTRLLRAKDLLQKKSATPSEVAFRVGFNSHAYFSKCFKEEFGISPSDV
jgi:DNA-binding response OmpR family regulator